MSPLTQAISQGFSAEQILEYLLRRSPQYSKQIQKALSQGFSAEQVVKYISKGRKGVNEFQGELTEHEKTRKSDIDKQKNLEMNIGKGALALGAAALGAYGLSRGAQAAIPEVLPAMQDTFNPRERVEIDVTPKIAQQTQQIEFQPPNQLIQQAKDPESPISPATQSQTPIQTQQPQLDFGQLLDQMGVKNKVDALRENNPPEVIAKVVRYGLPKEKVKQLESQLQMPLDQVISGYLQSAPPVETMPEKIAKGVPFGQKEEEIKPQIPQSQPTENRFKDVIEEGRRKFDSYINLQKPQEIPLKIKHIEEKDLYHQTTREAKEKIEKEGFQLRKGSKKDIELPHGVYMKPSDLKIELPGSEQLSVKAKLGKVAHFKDRDEFKKYIFSNSKEYKNIYEKFEKAEKEQLEILNELDKNLNNYSDEQIERLDHQIEKLERKIENLVEEGREISTKHFIDKGIDSIHVERDVGGHSGKSVETYISLNPERVKVIGSEVLLPDGQMGEIEDVKQGIAKVKVGDKIRHKKLDELMESPKEAAVAALELIKSFTPEAKRSAHHALNMYDPQTRSAQFLFHSGDGYVVDDISPEEYERLSNEIEEAKTSGENKIGAWSTGVGSRGAAYQKIVKNLKKPYRKIQVGYNLFKEFQRLINEKEE